MNKDCKECQGKCCVGDIEVFPSDEIYNDSSLTIDCKAEDYDKIMRTDKQNKCIALKDGLCMIYKKRPSICREFEFEGECCNKLRQNKIKEHKCSPCKLVLQRRQHDKT